MKKRKIFLSFIACICLMFCCGFVLTGCGDQFIEERDYQLINMQVIKDNSPSMYSPMESGMFYDVFIGNVETGMAINKMTVSVGRKNSVLTFDDSKRTGIVVTYNFEVYTDDDVYPAYAFKNYTIKIGNIDASTLSQNDIDNLPQDTKDLYQEVYFVTQKIFINGDASIQLVTQNKSFVCHIIVNDKQDASLLFMGVLYGY